MVRSITSFSHSGLRDWFFQRVSAAVLLVYAIILASFFFKHHPVEYTAWVDFFSSATIKIATIITLFSLVVHAWIGLWVVYTDYIKPTFLRMTLQVLTIIGLLTLLVWGTTVLWG